MHDDLTIARAIYRERVEQFPGRLIMLCDRARPSLEHSVCDESVDNPDYHDGRKSNCPIGNLNARYRRFPAKPFHGFPPRWAPGEKRSTGDYAVIGLTDAPKIVSGSSRRPCRVFFC
jgi:hypothetical protein